MRIPSQVPVDSLVVEFAVKFWQETVDVLTDKFLARISQNFVHVACHAHNLATPMKNIIDDIKRTVNDNQILIGHELNLMVWPDQLAFFFHLRVLPMHVLILNELLIIYQHFFVQFFVNFHDPNVVRVNFVQSLKLLVHSKFGIFCFGQQVHYLFERTVLLRDLLPEL